MKRIDKLTEEQKAQMKPWVDKWIEIGLRTGNADWDTFDEYMPVCYEKAGIPYPPRVVRVASPLIGGLASAIAEAIWKKRRQGDGIANNAVNNAVNGAVNNAVNNAVGNAVDDAVRNAVNVAVDNTVGNAVNGAVYNAVNGAVYNAVDNAVRDAVDNAVRDAVTNAVTNAVNGAVRGVVGNAVNGAVANTVGNAVNGAVYNAVNGAVRGVVANTVGNAVDDAKLIIRKLGLDISWHPWLGGQFWVGGFWGSPSFVSFFAEVCGLELDQDIQERATAYRKVCESVNYIWPNRNFIIVCDRPKEIHTDENSQLHNENGLALRYGDGWGLHMWHGIKVPEWFITTPAEDLTIDHYTKLESADQKIAFIEKAGIGCLTSQGKLLDSYENYLDTELAKRFPIEVSEYELYDMSSIFDGDERAVYLSMKHLSTGATVFECVDNNRTLPKALAYRLNLPVSIINEIEVTDAV